MTFEPRRISINGSDFKVKASSAMHGLIRLKTRVKEPLIKCPINFSLSIVNYLDDSEHQDPTLTPPRQTKVYRTLDQRFLKFTFDFGGLQVELRIIIQPLVSAVLTLCLLASSAQCQNSQGVSLQKPASRPLNLLVLGD